MAARRSRHRFDRWVTETRGSDFGLRPPAVRPAAGEGAVVVVVAVVMVDEISAMRTEGDAAAAWVAVAARAAPTEVIDPGSLDRRRGRVTKAREEVEGMIDESDAETFEARVGVATRDGSEFAFFQRGGGPDTDADASGMRTPLMPRFSFLERKVGLVWRVRRRAPRREDDILRRFRREWNWVWSDGERRMAKSVGGVFLFVLTGAGVIKLGVLGCGIAEHSSITGYTKKPKRHRMGAVAWLMVA